MGSLTIFTQVADYLKQNKVTLVAVSKTQSNEAIMDRYNLGQRIFGENRVQELVAKQLELPKDIQWHQIGHLQTNKVKLIVPFVSMIHAGDSIKLLRKINSEAKNAGKVIDVLIQAKVAQEDTKYGFSPKELKEDVLLSEIASFDSIRICGLMGMASFTSDQEQICQEMKALRQIFDTLQSSHYFGDEFQTLSMGMSGDYKLAIQEGSTMVRIGSLIF